MTVARSVSTERVGLIIVVIFLLHSLFATATAQSPSTSSSSGFSSGECEWLGNMHACATGYSSVADFQNFVGDDIGEIVDIFSGLRKTLQKGSYESSADFRLRYGREIIKTKYKDRNLFDLVFVMTPNLVYDADKEVFTLTFTGQVSGHRNRISYRLKPSNMLKEEIIYSLLGSKEIPVPRSKAKEFASNMKLRLAIFGGVTKVSGSDVTFGFRRMVLFDSNTGATLVDKDRNNVSGDFGLFSTGEIIRDPN